MFDMNHYPLVNQYQQNMREQAEKWRLAHQKDEYQPNRSIRRNKRKRQHQS